jgi:hypothetical protein
MSSDYPINIIQIKKPGINPAFLFVLYNFFVLTCKPVKVWHGIYKLCSYLDLIIADILSCLTGSPYISDYFTFRNILTHFNGCSLAVTVGCYKAVFMFYGDSESKIRVPSYI